MTTQAPVREATSGWAEELVTLVVGLIMIAALMYVSAVVLVTSPLAGVLLGLGQLGFCAAGRVYPAPRALRGIVFAFGCTTLVLGVLFLIVS